MKSLAMYLINKQTEGLVRRNSFSVVIDETKLVKGVRLYQHYNAIVGGFHPKVFVCVDGMIKVDLHDHLEVIRSDKNKSDRAYEVKIAVFPIQRVHIGKSSYIVLAGNPQLKNEINDFGTDVLCKCDSASAYLDWMRFLKSDVGGVSCEYKWVQETFFLHQQLAAYKREESSPTRFCPLPISIFHTLDAAAQGGTNLQQAITDLAWISFFFLMRPGDHCQGGADAVSTPFRLRDIQFFAGNQPTPVIASILQECAAANFSSLLFTNNNNRVKGESIVHGTIEHPMAYAVAAIRRRAEYLQHHVATRHTPLDSVFMNNKWTSMCSTDNTKALRSAVAVIGPQISFTPEEFRRTPWARAAPWHSSGH